MLVDDLFSKYGTCSLWQANTAHYRPTINPGCFAPYEFFTSRPALGGTRADRPHGGTKGVGLAKLLREIRQICEMEIDNKTKALFPEFEHWKLLVCCLLPRLPTVLSRA